MEGNVVFKNNISTAIKGENSIGGPLPSVDFDEPSLMNIGALAGPPAPY